mgnify:CR=1 FL=1
MLEPKYNVLAPKHHHHTFHFNYWSLCLSKLNLIFQIPLDIIVDLASSRGRYDILVIVDHVTKVYQNFPCNKTIPRLDIAKLLFDSTIKLHWCTLKVIYYEEPQYIYIFGISFLNYWMQRQISTTQSKDKTKKVNQIGAISP